VCAGAMLACAAAASSATPTRTIKVGVAQTAVGVPKQRAVGYATIRTPLTWGHRSARSDSFVLHPSAMCTVSVQVGVGLMTAGSPTRQLHKTFDPRYSPTVVSGATSAGHGVWGAEIYDPPAEFMAYGISVVKLASQRMAQLSANMIAAPTCQPADHTEAYIGPLEHMLRTARFHLRLKTL
jgi:hypothetical protein